MTSSRKPLEGKVALVAGATRGAGRGIAVELGAAGATVYVTGRSSREGRSEYDRPETIEETAELVTEAGGEGIPVRADHLVPEQVRDLVERIDREQGRLDVLVNDIWGGELLFSWDDKLWEHSLDKGLRILRLAIDTHIITSHYALPLLIRKPGGLVVEVTDGTAEYNWKNYRVSFFYDLAKVSVNRMAFAQARELARVEAVTLHHGGQDAVVGRAVVALAADPDVARWNGQSLSSGGLAQVYGFTDVDGSRPDCWRYIVEVQDAGKPADVTGYR